MRRVFDIDARAVKWLYEQRIPRGMLTTIAGRPGSLKSSFGHYLIKVVSQHYNVLLLDFENRPHQTMRPRLEHVGANLKRVHFDKHLLLPEDLGQRESEVDKHRAELVVLDPWSSYLTVSRSGESIRRVTDPLDRIAEDHDCAIVIVDHTLRGFNDKSNPLSAISKGLAEACPMVLIGGRHKTPDSDGERFVLCAVKYSIRSEPLAYTYNLKVDEVIIEGEPNEVISLSPVGEERFRPLDLLVPTEEEQGSKQTKLAKASDWLRRYLFGCEGHLADCKQVEHFAVLEEISVMTVRRAREEMQIEIVKPSEMTNEQLGILGWSIPQDSKKRAWKLPDAFIEELEMEAEEESNDE